jgi:hypothetical protein
MRLNDAQLGKPAILFKDTKANIEARTDLVEGMEAYATDTNEFGTYNGSAWMWTTGGGKYRQFVYEVSGGDFTFVIDEDGNPVMALEVLE